MLTSSSSFSAGGSSEDAKRQQWKRPTERSIVAETPRLMAIIKGLLLGGFLVVTLVGFIWWQNRPKPKPIKVLQADPEAVMVFSSDAGQVTAVRVAIADKVEPDSVVVMVNDRPVRAGAAGSVLEIKVVEGDQVKFGAELVKIKVD